MLKLIGSLFAKLSLASLVREIELDVDTVEKAGGYYLRIRVEAFGRKIIDRYVRVAAGNKVNRRNMPEGDHTILRLDKPIDVHDPPGTNLPEWTRKANDRLKRSMEREPINL